VDGEGREKEELLSKLSATAGRLAETETALEETKTSLEVSASLVQGFPSEERPASCRAFLQSRLRFLMSEVPHVV